MRPNTNELSPGSYTTVSLLLLTKHHFSSDLTKYFTGAMTSVIIVVLVVVFMLKSFSLRKVKSKFLIDSCNAFYVKANVSLYPVYIMHL